MNSEIEELKRERDAIMDRFRELSKTNEKHYQESLEARASCAVMRERLEALLEVHEFIDDEDGHQTKATEAVLNSTTGKDLLDALKACVGALESSNKFTTSAGERCEICLCNWDSHSPDCVVFKALTQARKVLP